MAYTANEMMTIAAARALRNSDICFVGIGLPSAACNLARLTHAPGITLIYESGTIATKPDVLPLSIGDGELCDTALTTVPVVEMFRYWLQGGRITVGFLGGAQIDRFANLNTTVIGPYDKPRTRLPGGGGAPEISSACEEIFIIMRQAPRSFVDKLDFVTSFGHGEGGEHRARIGLREQGSDQAGHGSRGVRARSGEPGNDGRLHPSRGDPRTDRSQYRVAGALCGQGRRDTEPDRAGTIRAARAQRSHRTGARGSSLRSPAMDGMREVFICDAVRTPIGRYGGALAKVRTDDLAGVPIKALVKRNPDVDWSALDEVVLGCANQAGEDNRNVARMALLLAGLPDNVPGVTVDRLCASGLNAIGDAARAIKCGETEFAIAGGVESMTRAPLVMGKAQEAFQRSADVHDTTLGWRFINPLIKAQYGINSMAETGENVAEEYQVARADQDAFALRSQQRAARAIAAGYFAEEIVAVEVPGGKAGPVMVERDEHARPETTLEGLAKLKPFARSPGTVTAGNASGVNDGAAAMLLASPEAAERHGLTPRGRVLAMASAAVPPRVMGIGPVPSTRKLMARLGLKIGAFDLIEINEAFAAQGLACLRQLGLADDAEEVNAHGGAIALGHPLGMSGARLALTALHGLERRGGKLALATMCVGVGQGVSLALERI